jgi:hypothetical protein
MERLREEPDDAGKKEQAAAVVEGAAVRSGLGEKDVDVVLLDADPRREKNRRHGGEEANRRNAGESRHEAKVREMVACRRWRNDA